MSNVGVFHPRADWTHIAARGGNNPHNGPKAWAVSPCRTVIVHYNGSSSRLGMPRDPAACMRSMQDWGWRRDGAGIEYNDVTFDDGSVWEGFGREVGAHCSTRDPVTGRPYSLSAYGLCWYGGTPDVPSDAAVDGLVWAINRAMNLGRVAADARIIGHLDTGFATSCPGPPLYARLPEIRARVGRPAPQPQPGDDDDMASTARRIRFRGFWNQYLAGAGTYQPVTEELLASGWGDVPLVVMDWHEQTVKAIETQCGPQVWVPSDGS